ncbi:hypothetical protein BAE44_0004362 [Dichanthelium oligosanthes]|uniref:DUF679 domain membrane protein 2 n=1 Tax=Dichanthelium oligosanthes TaxID=888268 RepID=A0A1E5WB19_9POAL|nr:hypothetical protein BAE44_0004362 [Dichanthelium oligosanthes]
MEEGIKGGEPKKAATDQQDKSTTTNTAGAMADVTFKSIGDVLKLLPTATVIVYEVLNPIVTNTGDCHAVGYKIATAVLLGICGFLCAFSTFTDSYVGTDGKVKYGLVTPRGLLPFADSGAASGGRDFSMYRLQFADFVHAAFAVAVFAAVSLLADANTVGCFYPSLKDNQKKVVMALPVVVGAVASVVFMVFPSTRHGIGYPPSKPEATALASQ